MYHSRKIKRTTTSCKQVYSRSSSSSTKSIIRTAACKKYIIYKLYIITNNQGYPDTAYIHRSLCSVPLCPIHPDVVRTAAHTSTTYYSERYYDRAARSRLCAAAVSHRASRLTTFSFITWLYLSFNPCACNK